MADPLKIAALYRFARFADPAMLREPLLRACNEGGIRGTLLLAPEGINGTIAGEPAAIDLVIELIRALPGCAGLSVKCSAAETMPFHRMKVRLKREIVTMGEPGINPLESAGHYVSPADWNALIDDPATLVIDTRNDYEVKIGSFDGAVDPATSSFSDFPGWARAHRDQLAGAPRIAMFCTGGIRCEKATALLKAEGFDEVYHLEGGILKYLEEIPAAESRWTGECFVFDERVAITHGLDAGTHALCRGCRMPVSQQDRISPLYVEGITCPACSDSRNADQRAGYAERHRQQRLAASRGRTHIGSPRNDEPPNVHQ